MAKSVLFLQRALQPKITDIEFCNRIKVTPYILKQLEDADGYKTQRFNTIEAYCKEVGLEIIIVKKNTFRNRSWNNKFMYFGKSSK